MLTRVTFCEHLYSKYLATFNLISTGACKKLSRNLIGNFKLIPFFHIPLDIRVLKCLNKILSLYLNIFQICKS